MGCKRGKVADLGSLGGSGYGGGNLALNINNLGQVVGNPGLPGDTENHAFLWSRACYELCVSSLIELTSIGHPRPARYVSGDAPNAGY